MPLSDSSPPPLRCSPSSHRNCGKEPPSRPQPTGPATGRVALKPASSPGAVVLACFPPSLDWYPYFPRPLEVLSLLCYLTAVVPPWPLASSRRHHHWARQAMSLIAHFAAD
ncbi:hypothetical protein EDB80DRAFT_681921 [Ilyonectria destructans]|nr:hypothetical protein EDB80DRAFT_681921 [Ilyonectria destructans]